LGCSARDSVNIGVYDFPNSVSIFQSGDYLICSQSSGAYAWYLNSVLLPNETNDSLLIQAEGEYALVFDAEGPCPLESNTIDIVFTGNLNAVGDRNPLIRIAENAFQIRAYNPKSRLAIWSVDGKLVNANSTTDGLIYFHEPGIYFVRLIGTEISEAELVYRIVAY
jgi:hypothetical protein